MRGAVPLQHFMLSLLVQGESDLVSESIYMRVDGFRFQLHYSLCRFPC